MGLCLFHQRGRAQWGIWLGGITVLRIKVAGALGANPRCYVAVQDGMVTTLTSRTTVWRSLRSEILLFAWRTVRPSISSHSDRIGTEQTCCWIGLPIKGAIGERPHWLAYKLVLHTRNTLRSNPKLTSPFEPPKY